MLKNISQKKLFIFTTLFLSITILTQNVYAQAADPTVLVKDADPIEIEVSGPDNAYVCDVETGNQIRFKFTVGIEIAIPEGYKDCDALPYEAGNHPHRYRLENMYMEGDTGTVNDMLITEDICWISGKAVEAVQDRICAIGITCELPPLDVYRDQFNKNFFIGGKIPIHLKEIQSTENDIFMTPATLVFEATFRLCAWRSTDPACEYSPPENSGQTKGRPANPETPGEDADTDTDSDQDGILDSQDNCSAEPNEGQQDSDGDGVGDACDNCVAYQNPNQTALDKELCKDSDDDGWADFDDKCPYNFDALNEMTELDCVDFSSAAVPGKGKGGCSLSPSIPTGLASYLPLIIGLAIIGIKRFKW